MPTDGERSLRDRLDGHGTTSDAPPLKFALIGLHSARRGDYRVVYRIDDERHRVEIVAIEHRADVYGERHW